MNSDYINDVEVKRAMERHETVEARVIPVILRPVDWQGAPFSKLQSLPSDVRPVTLWPNRDEAFLDVTNGIRKALQDLSDPSVGIPASLDIPNPPKVGFVSRRDKDNEDFLERVRDELAPGNNQLVVLWGAGGVGKTAIAAEAVRGLIERFARRIAWVSADGLESFGLSTLLDGIATQLGHSDLRKLPLDLKKEQVRELVKSGSTLIVLDNFETIEPAAERVHCAEWLGRPAPCSALITTRDVIEDAHNIPIEVMRAEEANDLLDQLIAQTHESRAFANLDRDRLITTAEANPLVLQWIVGQIDLAQDPDEVLDELQQGEGRAADRVFNRSYELKQLDNGGRAVLLALSLFAPSGSRKAVAEVSGLGKDKDRKKFRDAVRSLSALWLIRTTDEGKKLAVEGLTRQLTKARLDNDPRAKTFRPRFVSRFLHFAETHARPRSEDYDALEQDKDNVLTALDIALNEDEWNSASRFMDALAYDGVDGFLEMRGYWEERIRYGEQILAAARTFSDERSVRHFAQFLANAHYDRAEFEKVRILCNECLDIARRLDDQISVAAALHLLAAVTSDQGNSHKARDLYNECLQIYERHRDIGRMGAVLHQLGWLAEQEGDLEEAKRLYAGSLQSAKETGDNTGIARALHQLGCVAQGQHDFPEARRLYQESLELKEQRRDLRGIATTTHQLGTMSLVERDFETAERLFIESLVILRRLRDNQNVAECLESIGKLRVAQGLVEEARAFFNEALDIAVTLGIPFRTASINHSLALLAERQDDKARAKQLFTEALEIFEKLQSPKAEVARKDLERLEGKAS